MSMSEFQCCLVAIFFEPVAQCFQREEGALEAGGFDVAFEGGEEAVVGDGGDFSEIRADDHFCEEGSGGGADRAGVAFKACRFDDRGV